MVEVTVDMDLTDNHEYVIKPSYDSELTGKSDNTNTESGECCINAHTDLKEQMDKLEAKIRVELKKVIWEYYSVLINCDFKTS